MNEQSNAPMPVEPSRSTGIADWGATWMDAVTKPSEQTYAMMAEHPDARSNGRAFTWVFLGGTISALISGVFQAILQVAGFAPTTPGLNDIFGGNAGRGVAFTFGIAICSSPIAGAITTLFFAIFVGITQWVAKLFKGTGTFSQLAYTIAAISVPFSLVSSVLTPFSGIQYVGICTGILSLLLGLYALFLEVTAVKAVNKFGWGPALGSVLLPGLVVACCLAIVFFGLLSALGPSFSDIFNSINQSP